ncbi:hypothetical protein WOLCODRAFT_160699 [Wolfiporia cocos MD-104 SS10]|uniref:Uncharacterized protein n=1 Tax=Wolfiporia cocos (strain MD-104) TaxID=742152 RepID=A0A2H3J642_WOLCO|nr:hypothetical protein WOLCODRAFT_160699 [Wolfiporia cocos MD-104 SS10]
MHAQSDMTITPHSRLSSTHFTDGNTAPVILVDTPPVKRARRVLQCLDSQTLKAEQTHLVQEYRAKETAARASKERRNSQTLAEQAKLERNSRLQGVLAGASDLGSTTLTGLVSSLLGTTGQQLSNEEYIGVVGLILRVHKSNSILSRRAPVSRETGLTLL